MKKNGIYYCCLLLTSLTLLTACRGPLMVDILIRNALIYDGSGNPPVAGIVAINADTIFYAGPPEAIRGRSELDAAGHILSWADEALLVDGRSMSDIKQGVTLEVFGEGLSMGPLSPAMKAEIQQNQGDLVYDIKWNTLAEFLDYLEHKGVSCNVASFEGAATVRMHELGFENRRPTTEELARMTDLVRQAMAEGALGVGSSLIYTPGLYADTEELVALCQAAAEYDGMYISHLRSESNRLLDAVDELITIADKAGLPAEIYHLKAAGKRNHGRLDMVLSRIDAARARGLQISADMYLYTAGATGLDAAMPPWVQEGGYHSWAGRLKDPDVRRQVAEEMIANQDVWENLYLMAGPDGVMLSEFKNPDLRHLIGKTVAEVAVLRGVTPEEAIMDLVIEDGSRVGAVYFLMSEENVRRQIQLPYMSFCSDAKSMAAEGVFLNGNPHPRAYGNFARLLGRYVREEKVISLEEAIHKLTAMTAAKLKIRRRGLLREGYFADVVIFDPQTIKDHATFENAHQYASGVHHVFVNGVPVLLDGKHTGEFPGRFVRGPGWQKEISDGDDKSISSAP